METIRKALTGWYDGLVNSRVAISPMTAESTRCECPSSGLGCETERPDRDQEFRVVGFRLKN